VRPQVKLSDLHLLCLGERVDHPVPRRVHLEPVAGLGRHEGALARMVLDLQAELARAVEHRLVVVLFEGDPEVGDARHAPMPGLALEEDEDRKSTRLNSSHDQISYAVFCLKKKKKTST